MTAEELVARVIGEHVDVIATNLTPVEVSCTCGQWSESFQSGVIAEHGRHRAAAVLAALTEAGWREPFAPRQVDIAALAIPDLTDEERAALIAEVVDSQQSAMTRYEVVVAHDMVAWLCRRCTTIHADAHLGEDDRPIQKGFTLADLFESAREHELESHNSGRGDVTP